MSTYNPKLSTVKVENLRLRAYIGFIEWETEKLQDVVISFSFKYDTAEATETDLVDYAVDYKQITKHIISLVDNKSFHLIETLAERIFEYIKSCSSRIQDIEIQVEKPNALRFADNVMIRISGKDRYNTAIIALGSNIDPEDHFTQALQLLENVGIIMQRSQFIYTKPLKFEEQPDFLNGAILFNTKKSLSELKMHLKQIEAILGRVRSENKNAPREIDLDLTTFNGFVVDPDLQQFPFLMDFVKTLQPEIELK